MMVRSRKSQKSGVIGFILSKTSFTVFSFHPALNDLEKKVVRLFSSASHLFVDIIVEIVYL